MTTYTVRVWDHDPPHWSSRLARAHIGGANRKLYIRQLRHALRILLNYGWTDLTIRVNRERKDD